MYRRSALTSLGTLLLATFAGCLEETYVFDRNDGDNDQMSGENNGENGVVTKMGKYAKECERHYLKTEVVSEDADSFSFSALVADTHDSSVITLLVDFAVGVQRDDEPEAQGGGEYRVYYYISNNLDDAYRTEDADEDPRDGMKVDC